MSTIKQRHELIIDLLKQKGGRISVSKLSEELGVSAVTIRHDLRTLAEENVLERVFGGAVLRESALPTHELSFEVRLTEAPRAKDAIAKFAAQFVKSGYGIAIDGSSSAYALVPYLKTLTNLTIVTNSLIIAQHFRDTPRNKVLVPSGRIRGESATIVGGTNSMPDINMNIGFFGAWGISVSGGITDVDIDEVTMRKAMIDRCLTVIIVADGRKWGEIAPYTYATPEQIDRIVTTEDAPAELVQVYRRLEVTVDVLKQEE